MHYYLGTRPKGGAIYSVVLFSVPHGIRWGPAAPHMACVQRVAGAAAEAEERISRCCDAKSR